MQFADPVEKDFTLQPFQILTGIFFFDNPEEIRLGAGDRYSLLFSNITKLFDCSFRVLIGLWLLASEDESPASP